jgi:hypothetical protein
MSGDVTDEQHTKATAAPAGIGESGINYYDIMIIGNTGQGKTTTADKILIANPDGRRYVAEYQPGKQPELTADEYKRQLSYSDITMWLAALDAEFETHLKFLTYCRSKDMPHEEVNKARTASSKVFRPTIDQCTVLSNETSKLRIMDVPGFFDGASILSKQKENAGAEHQEPMSPVEQLDVNNLDIMRKIIRVQTNLALKFKRILYFLPIRGPLERSNAHLVLELKWMAHYLGTSIFKTMVLVATVQATFSEMPIPDDKKFPQEDIDLTKRLFRETLKKVFSSTSEGPLPDPPLIFISLTNTCEEILAKIQSVPVQQEGLHLQFNPSTCAECGMKIGVIKGQRFTCSFGEDFANVIPYEESTCHPFFVPRYTRIDKIWSGFKHIVSFRWATGEAWPVFEGEKCVSCQKMPNTRGCMKVKSFHGKGNNRMEVDHTNQVVNPVPDEQAAEDGDANGQGTPGEAIVNSSVAAEPAPVPQNETTQHDQPQSGDNQENAGDVHASAEASIVALETSGTGEVVGPQPAKHVAANVSFVDHNVLECDYNGIEYTNKKHNFSLQIPEGAISKGEKVCFEIAIAMHGPFILPKNTRLVSPILWLCPFEENVTFNKPFQVVLPHILHKITKEKAEEYQLGFTKANHRNISYNKTGDAMYSFQPLTSLECVAIFSSTNELGFGTATMSHFCYLCITAKNKSELKSDIGYCLTRAQRPATALRHEVCFCVSYCLGTCIEVGYT